MRDNLKEEILYVLENNTNLIPDGFTPGLFSLAHSKIVPSDDSMTSLIVERIFPFIRCTKWSA